jgi:hypothetical protein
MTTLAELRALAHRQAAADYLDHAEAVMLAALRRALDATLSPALGRLGLTAAAVPDPDDLHIIRAAWLAAIDDELVPLIAELFTTGALGTLVTLGDAATARGLDDALDAIEDTVDRRAAEWLEQAHNRLVGLGDEAWAAARGALLDGFVAGDSIELLAGRVTEAIDVAYTRAQVIARTEVVSASNAGSIAGARLAAPFAPVTKTWMATLDARTRPSHADADGQVVGLDEPFDIGGDALDFPGDPGGSPEEVINCRCTVVYDQATIADEGRQTGGTDVELPDLAASAASTQEAPVAFRTVPRPPWLVAAPGDEDEPLPDEEPTEDPAEDEEEEPEVVVPVPEGMEGRLVPFSTIMAIEGRWTGDDRYLLPGAVRWDGMLPVPFTNDHEDTVASVAGLVGEVRRLVDTPNPGENLIVGYGLLDLGPTDRPNEEALDVRDRVETGALRGVSIRIDDMTIGGVDPDTIAEGDDEWWMQVVEDCRLRALSPTPVAAFAECAIFLNPDDITLAVTDLPQAPDNPAVALPQDELPEPDPDDEEPGIEVVVAAASGLPMDMLVAAGAHAPDPGVFADPGFTELTPLTISEHPDAQGRYRVAGHIAEWGTCHTGFSGQCITPPHSPSAYSSFNRAPIVCADGTRVPVGRLTMGTGHASTRPGTTPAMAMAHYDNTGTGWAIVHAGEDAFGPWVAGVTVLGLSEAALETAQTTPPSGDWRDLGRGLDLIAVLNVNVPGFPVTPRARVASTGPAVLQAAGIVRRGRHRDPVLDAAGQRIAASIGLDRRQRAKQLAARVRGEL